MSVTLLAAELLARVALDPPRYHNEPLELDPELGFRGIPGHRVRKADEEGALYGFALNADGFRGRALPEEGSKPEGVTRIAFVGDSFLVGEGLPEEALLTTKVGQALAASGIANEVYNLSAADYGTGQELLLLRRFAARLAPDQVVLAVYPGNDLVNNFEGLAGRTAVSPGDYVRPYVVPGGGRLDIRHTHPLRHGLRHGSRLFAWLERRLLSYAAANGLTGLYPFPQPASPEDRLAEGRAPDESLELFRAPVAGDRWAAAWERSFGLLRAFRAECDALSARLLVVVIPNLHQVRLAARDVYLDLESRRLQGRRLDQLLDWNLPERRLVAFFEEEGIEYTLLLPALRAAVQRGHDVYLPDLHLNTRGHAIAASLLAGVITGERRAGVGEPRGAPVPLPRGGDAPATIRLGGAEHWHYRDAHWVPWSADSGGEIQGALAVGQGFVALPGGGARGPRELVVRGIAAARRYPLEIELAFVSGPTRRFEVAKAGPFVLRVRVPTARVPHSDGYLGLRIGATGSAQGAPTTAGVIVRELGFE